MTRVAIYNRDGVRHAVRGYSARFVCGRAVDAFGRHDVPAHFSADRDAWRFMDASHESTHCPECMVILASGLPDASRVVLADGRTHAVWACRHCGEPNTSARTSCGWCGMH